MPGTTTRSRPSRREFLKIARSLVAVGLARESLVGLGAFSASAAQQKTPTSSMKLSLSVRVAETFGSKEKSSMTIDQLIRLAKRYGYEALCMRASQAGVHTPAEVVRKMSAKIRAAGLAVSMVTGDFAVPRNDEHGPDGLRDITPYLGLAQAFGADLIRICMKKEEDIPWAQKASDEARERGIRLVHQAHCASLFETVEGSLACAQSGRASEFWDHLRAGQLADLGSGLRPPDDPKAAASHLQYLRSEPSPPPRRRSNDQDLDPRRRGRSTILAFGNRAALILPTSFEDCTRSVTEVS